MLLYQYKDKRVKNALILLTVGLPIIRAAAVFGSVPSLICFVLVALAGFAVYQFQGKVRFTEDEAVFGMRRIKLETISSIAFSEKELSYRISYENKTYSRSISMQESEADIETYRNVLAELVSRVRMHNTACVIDDRTSEFIHVGSEFSNLCAEMCKREKGALKGLGGVLAYIVLSLIISCFIEIRDFGTTITSFLTLAPNTSDYFFGLAELIVFGASTVLTIIAAILLFLKKHAFKKIFIIMLAYSLAYNLLFTIISYIFFIKQWPTLEEAIGYFVISPANSIALILIWSTYFKRSIRVRNTFKSSTSSPPAISEGDAQ